MPSTATASKYLARHRKKLIDEILRVNHAGELGADRIYYGQVTALKSREPDKVPIVQHMWDQEKEHLRTFEKLIVQNRSERSLLSPLWNVGGFALGYLSASLGSRAAMATTVAVEKVITEHYDQQLRKLYADKDGLEENKQLIELISKFRNEEQEHHDTGLEHEAEKTPFYNLIYHGVQTLCKVSIKIAEKI